MTQTVVQEPTEEELRTPYELLGGETGIRALVDRFYDIMDRAPYAQTIRAMHGPDLAPMRDRLFAFMSGWLGGPALYSEQRPGVCIRSAHSPFAIGKAERDAWLRCMFEALDAVGAASDTKRLLEGPLLRIADLFRSH